MLNGGEAAVRDRTTARGFDAVDRNFLGARSVLVGLFEVPHRMADLAYRCADSSTGVVIS